MHMTAIENTPVTRVLYGVQDRPALTVSRENYHKIPSWTYIRSVDSFSDLIARRLILHSTCRLDDSPERDGNAAAELVEPQQPQRTNFRIKHPSVKVIAKRQKVAPSVAAGVPEPSTKVVIRDLPQSDKNSDGAQETLLGLGDYGSDESS